MPGWYEVYNDNSNHLVGIELLNNQDNVIQTTAVQHQWVHDIWTRLSQDNNSLAQGASAWTGIANITVPLLSTTCINAANYNSTMNLWADSPMLDSSNITVIPVHVGAVSGTDFTGANCTIDIRQGYFREFLRGIQF